jgi:hypothetical protein
MSVAKADDFSKHARVRELTLAMSTALCYGIAIGLFPALLSLNVRRLWRTLLAFGMDQGSTHPAGRCAQVPCHNEFLRPRMPEPTRTHVPSNGTWVQFGKQFDTAVGSAIRHSKGRIS